MAYSISPLRTLNLVPLLYIKCIYSKVPHLLVKRVGGWKSLWKTHMTFRGDIMMTPSTSANQFEC